ncbi:hypothetical protein [Allofranklinella schreckenbergeri]|nr:hypothetical protein [Allofranklinella schreckenbergeri]
MAMAQTATEQAMSDKPDEAAIIKYLLNELIEAKASIAHAGAGVYLE